MIKGRVLLGITPEILVRLDEYEAEGDLYLREIVEVDLQGDGRSMAYVYIGKPKALKPYFKRGYLERDRIEEFIDKNVNRYLKDKAERCLLIDRKQLSLKVSRELLSEEIESLLSQFFHDAGLPPFIIKHEIEKASIPELAWLRADKKAQKYAKNYIQLAVKFMIFNQIEERFRNDYRGFVSVADAYYQHIISALMALKLLTDHQDILSTSMAQLRLDRYDPDYRYTDYAVAAIFIAEELYNKQRADEIADWVKMNRHVGLTPLGAELEFTNLGIRAIKADEDEDVVYDSFYYFYDFDLMRRGWKLGAHVDDHGFLTSTEIRTRGFLELAFGRYKLFGDVSKPATQDPWILAQMIDLAVRFIEVRPHSLHISLQTSPNAKFKKLQDPEFFLCLLLLGGDLREDPDGKLREMRIFREEILHHDVGVCLSRLNRHHRNPEDQSWSFVVEYQYPRLYYDYDYQPLIMALKGFQLEANPYPFKDYPDCPVREFQEDMQTALLQWSAYPTPVSDSSLQTFLNIVEKGLEKEAKQMGAEYREYTQAMLAKIEAQLRRRNQRIYDYHVEYKRKIRSDYS